MHGKQFLDSSAMGVSIPAGFAADRPEFTNGAVAADKTVSTRYPLSKLAGLGDIFGWSGTLTVDGADVDRCLDGDAKTTFPNS